MAAEAERISLCHRHIASREIRAEELLHHREGLGICHNLHIRVFLCRLCDICRVIRLHMGNDQIIRCASAQRVFQIFEPLVSGSRIHRIHDRNLLIQNQIRVVGYTVGNNVLTLKQIQCLVICANVNNIF